MNILEGKLLGSTILIRKPKAEDTSAGGVILPASIVDEQNNSASSRIGYKVISTGHQVVNVKPNDTVLTHRNTQYNHLTHNGEDYMIVDESECVMVWQMKDEELITLQTAIKLLK